MTASRVVLVPSTATSFVACALTECSPMPEARAPRRMGAMFGVLATALCAAKANLPAAAQSSAPEPSTLAMRIDSSVRRYVASVAPAGIVVAVVRKGDTLALRGHGERSLELHAPMDSATVFRIGSVTKQFTAAAILRLEEEGRLRLTQTVGDFLPQYPRWSRITLRQLLNHTSGLPEFQQDSSWQRLRANRSEAGAILDVMARAPLRFSRGTRVEYSNTGYLLLGRIVEAVTHETLAAYWSRTFFVPLGMTRARVCADGPPAPDDAHGYEPSAHGMMPAASLPIAPFGGAGALCMSALDLLRWQRGLMDGRVLRTDDVARMTASDTLADGRPTHLGWGVIPREIGGIPAITHGGDIDGFSVEQGWLPRDSLQIVVLTNTFGSRPASLVESIVRVVNDLPSVKPATGITEALRAAVGTYRMQFSPERTATLVIWTAGEELFGRFDVPGQHAFPLIALPNGELASPAASGLRIQLHREGRGVPWLEFRQNGVVLRGERVLTEPIR